MADNKKSVLFICLGNICRSPMAEAVFCQILKEKNERSNWRVESAALGAWHVGNSPDRRTMKVLSDKGVEYTHKARKISKKDFNDFDIIFGMDTENMDELKEIAPKGSTAKLELLGSYDPQGDVIIEDPYYQRGDDGFFKCYEQCLRSCTAFLKTLE